MAEFYKCNNRKMMTHDSFSTSHEDISYMEKLPAIPNSVSYVSETKPKISAVGIKQQIPQSNSANYAVGKKLSIVNCTLLIVFCLLFGGKAWGQATVTTVLSENFEHSGSLPSGWSQQWSSPVWQAITNGIGNSSHPSSAHGGSYFVGMYYGDSDCDYNALITPSMNLSTYTRANLKFYLHKEDWGSDADDLTIQYRTSTSGSWTSIASFSSSISSWTLCTVVLPNLSSTYQIRFYGNSCYGYGIYIDDVVVEGITCPSITSLPFLETFNSDSPTRDCWTIVDANSDGKTWNYTTSTDVAGYPYNSNSSANDWLISPKISIASGAKLTFDYSVASSSYDEKFQVYVMSSPSNYGSATNILGTQTVNNTSWQTINAISLSAYAGQDIHIGIKCISNSDMYNLYIDNFKVSGPPPYAAEWVSAEVGSTSSWCIGETRTITLQVKNTGTATWYNSAANGGDNSGNQTDHDMVAVSYKWDEDEWYDSHPNTRNHFDRNIAPGETATITFDVEGPRKSGANHLRFNLIRQECCWFSYQNDCSNAPEKVVDVTVPALALTASPTTLCDGEESVLSMSCGQTADFYEYEPYIWDWSSNSYYSSGNQPTHIGSPVIERSIIKFTTAGNDPSIDMYNIGSYNPSIYKYVRMRYRVTGGNAGSVQIFYQSTTGNNSGGAHGDYYKNGTLTSDNQWHIVEIDMSTHPLWTSNGNIRGWRLDPCTASGVTMEIDWIGLFPDPIATGESMLSVSPTQNTTYSACNYMVNRSCIHKATKTITVATSPTITSSPDIATTCFNSSRQVTLTASGAANIAQPYSYTEGFEGGSMPTDWTQSGSGTWSVGKGDYSESTGAHGGTYNAKITHSSRGYETYLITPELDLSGLSSPVLEFWYINRDWSDDIDALTVYYRVNNGSWTQLFATGYNSHESWTKAIVNLTGVAAGYQLGFKMTDDYGYGVSIDDISITGTKYVAPTYSWSSTGTSSSVSGATYTVTPREGSNTYTVSASGCSRSVSIDVLTADNITASGATTDCGTPVTLTASGIDGATYNWYSDAACNTLVQENSSSYTPQNITSNHTYYVKATEDYLGGDLYEYAVRDFGYTGSVQEFVIPEGTEALKLEVWGAQGGNADSRFTGGYGGYSYGTYSVSRGKLYIAVGGQGTTDNGSYSSSTSLAGGWNGGGAGRAWTGTSHSGAGGGGATHIATATGVLSGLSSNRGAVLIVAGGGGGASDNGNGGNGGGTSGAAGNGTGGCAAGTQTSGSAWGYATNCTYTDGECGGGGGGWYGGYSATAENYAGGGGSGYLNPVLTSSSTTAGQRSGNGYARITIYKRSPIPCTSSAKSVALTVNPLPTPTVTSNSPICEGSQAQLQIQSPNNDYTYSWYSGSTNVANATSYSPTLNSGATYTVNANSTHDQILATYDFDYTGEMQEVVAPANTSYAILEVWGAEGGRSRGNSEWKANGGMGGYSKGKFATSSGQHFYVVVGGKGHDAVLGDGVIAISAIGGYNGGGGGTCDNDPASDTGREAAGAGGGATHIAKAAPSGSTNYQLRNYSSNRNDVLIVAGGGGGASWSLAGGAGGGETGGSGTTTGTIIYGGFGYGANAVGMGQNDGVGGGGGGWQGGNACSASSGGSNAGGGSGYIGGVTEGTTTGGVRSGNGHARIVFYRNGGGSCVSADRSVSVVVNTAPTAPTSISGTTPICSGSSTTLTAAGGSTGSGATYQWGTGTTVGSNIISGSGASVTVSPNANTTYWVRRVGNSACTNTTGGATQLITVNTAPTAPTSISGSNICLGNNTELSVLGGSEGDGSTYQWGTGTTVGENTISGNTSTITVTPTETTTYWVRRVGNTACVNNTDGVTKQITVNTPNPSASGTYDYIWRGGSTDWNTASNWYMYSGGNYSVASSIPATAKNYFIGTGTCLPTDQWPSLSADATVGNVTIDGGSVTIPANKTLSIAGSVNGTLTAQDNSTIEFVGSDDQTLSDAATFSNVTVAQAVAGKKIIAPNGIAVNGLATFGTGVVSADVSFGGSASATGASLTSYVDGTVTKTLGSSAFTFPIGNNGVLGEVDVPATRSGGTVSMHFNKSASADGFDVENDGYPRFWNINDMCAEDGANRFHHVSNAEYWDISSTAVVSGVNFRSIAASDVHFTDTSINQRDVDAIKFAIYDGCWKNMGGTASVSGNYYELAVTGVTIPATNRAGLKGSFGSTDDATLLPIELTSFTATCDGRSALVEWSTASERNNDYFSLERSDDAINFTEIARVAGAGNSIEPIDYAYTDYGIHGGDNYYRLVQVDYDGTRTVSEIVVANCIEPEVGEPDVQAYPNPFNDELTVVLDNFGNRAATIEVYDMLGKLIYTNKVAAPQNSYETILNLSNLPPAAYTVRVSTNDFVINKNVVKN